jgi:hypothetical protein
MLVPVGQTSTLTDMTTPDEQPLSANVHVPVTADELYQLEELAAEQDLNVEQLARQNLTAYLAQERERRVSSSGCLVLLAGPLTGLAALAYAVHGTGWI